MTAPFQWSMPAIDPTISLSLRASLALMFAAAAYHKAIDLPKFRSTLSAYRVLPDQLVASVAGAVVCSESALAIGLVSPGLQPIAATMAIGLLAVYTAAIGINLARGRRDLDCGCGGPNAKQPIGPGLVARNSILLLAAVGAAAPTTSRGLIWLDGVALAGTLVAVTLLWTAANGLLAVNGRLALRAAEADS